MSLIAILDIVFVLASMSFLLLKSLEAEFFWTSVCDSFNWRRNNCQVLNVQSVNCHRHQRGQPSLPKFPGMFTCRYIFMGSAHFSQFPPTASCIKKFWANLHCSQKWPMLASTPDSFQACSNAHCNIKIYFVSHFRRLHLKLPPLCASKKACQKIFPPEEKDGEDSCQKLGRAFSQECRQPTTCLIEVSCEKWFSVMGKICWYMEQQYVKSVH